MKANCIPTVFWHSDPVNPDETLVLSGGNFSGSSVVELAEFPEQAKLKWIAVKPLQPSEISLKAVIPASFKPGRYACRVKDGEKVSKTFYVNAPDVWWKQGDDGVDRTHQGSWLRVLGKCLAIQGIASIVLRGYGKEFPLELDSLSCYSLSAKIPKDLEPGRYEALVGNGSGGKEGLCNAGELEVLPLDAQKRELVNVVDFGADPAGLKDSTFAIVQATERLTCLGGGILYFPRGRYRIDSILRSGTWIESPLLIPEKILLRGAGMDLTTLWWPDHEKALPTLIDGRKDFGVEDLSIYTQGHHSTIITGTSNVRIRNVRIRANSLYMTNPDGRPHHLRKVTPPYASGAALMLWGENNQVTGCDILSSDKAFDLRLGRGNYIAGNKIRAKNFHFMHGVSEMIFENNEFTGNSLVSGGCNLTLFFGANSCRHVYYAHNASSHIYGGDHECLTFDGHFTRFFGGVKEIKPDSFSLVRMQPLKENRRRSEDDLRNATVYIVDGRGAGQYRRIKAYAGDAITLEQAWDIEPDSSSLIEIGGFNGRHLIIGNSGSDVGTLVQLYPSNCEVVVAENKGLRASNINSLGKLSYSENTGKAAFEVSWRNQFLDNEVVVGNGWGGGTTEVDRWIGGEATLNIWGWGVIFHPASDGASLDKFLTPEVLRDVLGESSLREHCIPISRFQIVRRHRIANNSSIKIHGAVADILVEGCQINASRRGIRVGLEIDYNQPEDMGQLFNFDPEPDAEHKPLPFLNPQRVLLRANKFDDVQVPCSGTALSEALVLA